MTSEASETPSLQLETIIESLANERQVSGPDVIQALQAGLEAATKRAHGLSRDADIRVLINPTTYERSGTRHWHLFKPEEALDDNGEPREILHERELTLEEAAEKFPGREFDDNGEIVEPIEPVDNRRIASQAAKTAINTSLRQAQRATYVRLAQEHGMVDKLVSGVVQSSRRDRDFRVKLNYGVIPGIEPVISMPRNHLLPGDKYRERDFVRGILTIEKDDQRGQQLILSRTVPEMVSALLTLEVPEIAAQTIEIKVLAREPGVRTKVAVKTNDARIDAIGTCVGMQGLRVQAVRSELCEEHVEIINWVPDMQHLLQSALEPAELQHIEVDNMRRLVSVLPLPDQQAIAIGKGGVNVRLAEQLLQVYGDWKLRIVSSQEFNAQRQHERTSAIAAFVNLLEFPEDVAQAIAEGGFVTIKMLAEADPQLIADHVKGVDIDTAKQVLQIASGYIETAGSSQAGDTIDPDLLRVDGIDQDVAVLLRTINYNTLQELADAEYDELLENFDDLDESTVLSWISQARRIIEEDAQAEQQRQDEAAESQTAQRETSVPETVETSSTSATSQQSQPPVAGDASAA